MKKLLAVLLVTFLLFVFAGCSNNKDETIETKVADTEAVTEAETQVQTKKETQPPTELLPTKEELLEKGMWILYSPQDMVFETHEFSDGIIINKTYIYIDGVVKRLGTNDCYMTYEIEDDKIVILTETGYECVWAFTDNPDIFHYSWQSYTGPEDGPVVTQKIYHHEVVPTYEEAVEEKENMWVR